MKLETFFIPADEADVRLEIVADRPPQDGPHPTIVFNHGSTGSGRNTSLYRRTVSPAVVDIFRFMTARAR